MRIYIPRDSSALSMGADEVASAISAEALKRKIDIGIVRNGSRGARPRQRSSTERRVGGTRARRAAHA